MIYKKDCCNNGKFPYPNDQKSGYCWKKMGRCKIKGCLNFKSKEDHVKEILAVPNRIDELSEEEWYAEGRSRLEHVGERHHYRR